MIGWYVHHHGRGHATRAAAVAARLRQPVTGLGSGPRPEGWPGEWVELARDDEGTHPVDVTAGGTLHWVPRHDAGLADRAAQLTAWVARTRPALLVCDVSVEVTLLARLSGVPVVVAVLPGERTDPAHVLAHDLAAALLCPWPPGTHDADWPARWRDKAWTVGALSRFDDRPRRAPTRRDAPRVLVLRGSGGWAASEDDLAAARAATPGVEWVERRGDEPAERVWQGLLDADVVVTHGGQNAVAEVAAARRPAVVVAQPRPFEEQARTATVLERAGIAVGVQAWPEPAAWPHLLDRALALGGSGWERWSSGDGAAVAARRLDDLADTLASGAHP